MSETKNVEVKNIETKSAETKNIIEPQNLEKLVEKIVEKYYKKSYEENETKYYKASDEEDAGYNILTKEVYDKTYEEDKEIEEIKNSEKEEGKKEEFKESENYIENSANKSPEIPSEKLSERRPMFYTVFSYQLARKLIRNGGIVADIALNKNMKGIVFHFFNTDLVRKFIAQEKENSRKYRDFKDREFKDGDFKNKNFKDKSKENKNEEESAKENEN